MNIRQQVLLFCGLFACVSLCAMDESEKKQKEFAPSFSFSKRTIFKQPNTKRVFDFEAEEDDSSLIDVDEKKESSKSGQSGITFGEKQCSKQLLDVLKKAVTPEEEKKLLSDFWITQCKTYSKCLLFKKAHYYAIKEVEKKGYSSQLERASFQAAKYADYYENWWTRNFQAYGPYAGLLITVAVSQFGDKIPGVNKIFSYFQTPKSDATKQAKNTNE